CVVAEQHHVAAADLRHAGDHPVAGHTAGVPREQVDLLERVAIDEPRDALARGQLALGVLSRERLRVAVAGLVPPLAELVERIDLPRGHFWMNIQRCPSMSSARYRLPPSSADRIVAPAAFARSKCAAASSMYTRTPSMM